MKRAILAIALLISSTQLRADELPFKVGDRLHVTLINGGEGDLTVERVVGKWIYTGSPRVRVQGHKYIEGWINTDTFLSASN